MRTVEEKKMTPENSLDTGWKIESFIIPAPSSRGWDKTGDMMLLSTSTRAPCA